MVWKRNGLRVVWGGNLGFYEFFMVIFGSIFLGVSRVF